MPVAAARTSDQMLIGTFFLRPSSRAGGSSAARLALLSSGEVKVNRVMRLERSD